MGGVPNQPFLVSHNDDRLNKGKCDLSNPLWNKVLELQVKRRRCPARATSNSTEESVKIRCRTRFLMKRRAFLERHRRSSRPVEAAGNGIKRKVRILKKLIPNSESNEMDTLFQEAADYVLALQMKVKAMQIMVDLLSGSDHHE